LFNHPIVRLRRQLRKPTLLLGLLVLLVVAVIWTVTLSQIRSDRADALDAENLKNDNLATFQQERVLRSLQLMDQALRAIRHEAKDGRGHEPLTQHMATLGLPAEDVRLVSVINEMGKVTETTGALPGPTYADRDYFQYHAEHADDHMRVGKPILGKVTGEWVITLSLRISRPDGQFAGVVFIAVRPTFLMSGLPTLPLSEHATLGLFGLDGTARVRRNNGVVSFGDDASKSVLFQRVKEAPTGRYVAPSTFDGRLRTISYRLLPAYGLIVSVGSSLEDMANSVKPKESIYTGTALLCSALVVLMGLIVNHSWSRIEDALRRVRANEQRFRAILNASPVPLAIVDDGVNMTYVNPAFERTFGYARDEIPTLQEWLPKAFPNADYCREALQDWQDELARSTMTSTPFQPRELRIHCKSGEDKYVIASAVPLPESSTGESLVVMYDITPQRMTQEALSTAVKEKNALLQEVHHRVKNNLQVITSLLNLESSRARHADTVKVLEDMIGRIRSMALLYEALHRTASYAAVRLDEYLRQLANEAFRSLKDREAQVALVLALEPCSVSMTQATPCGLIVNELISNALKHAFPNDRTGVITISLQSAPGSGRLVLQFSDNGVGLPEDFEERRQHSLGLQLVGDLALQIGGTLHIEAPPSATFRMAFTSDAASN
jgi:PAS domain S-box-containing protein